MKHLVILFFLIPILLMIAYVSGCTSSREATEKQRIVKPVVIYPIRQNHEIPLADYVKVKDDCNLLKGKQRSVIYYIDSVRYAKAAPEPVNARVKELLMYKCKDLVNETADYNDRIILVTTEKIPEDEESNLTIRFNDY